MRLPRHESQSEPLTETPSRVPNETGSAVVSDVL